MSDTIKAPWTKEQVAALQVWQDLNFVHPFTCRDRGDHPVVHGDHGILVPTVRGWVCQFCDYTQDWAHDFMFTPLINPMEMFQRKTDD